jgi:fatty-acyl-CoA synthase
MAVDYLDLQARLQPWRLAARDLTTGRAWRYGQFDEDVWRVAGALLGRGVGAGDRVAVLAKNRVFQILLHLACARMGAVLVPLNWRLTPAELGPILRDAEPALVLGDALLGAAGFEGVDLDGFEAEAFATPALGAEGYDQARTSLILYTSGTSGRPKGVMLSERNNWATGQNFGVLSRVDSRSVMLSDAPMFHVIGLVGCVRPVLMHGGAVLVSDGFQAARTLARLGDEGLGVTHYFGVPTMAAMLRQEAGFDAGALRGLTGIFTGGAPLAPDLIRAWGKDGIALANGYGMTEAAGTVCGMPVEIGEIERHIGACGVIPPGVEVRVVDSDGRDVPEGSEGEIVVRGDNVSAG